MRPPPIDFTDPNDLEAVTLAQLGMSNKVIAAHCPNLISHGAKNPHGKINYRLKKAAILYELEVGKGFRTLWRDGSSTIAQDVMKAILPKLKKQAKGFLAVQVAHPRSEFVQAKEKKPRTVESLARQLEEKRKQQQPQPPPPPKV